jgi:hypothetical protein
VAQDASVFLRLDTLARVEQSIPTIIGTEYTLTFHVGAANTFGETLQTAKLYLDGTDVGDYSVLPLSGPGTGVVWDTFTYSFFATSDSTEIGFGGSSGSGNLTWTMLDNVSLVAVPEPASGLLGALGLGMMLRRRR